MTAAGSWTAVFVIAAILNIVDAKGNVASKQCAAKHPPAFVGYRLFPMAAPTAAESYSFWHGSRSLWLPFWRCCTASLVGQMTGR